MPRYVFGWNYRSNLGAGSAGDTVDLDPDVADAINRDSPGVLTAADTRALDAPPADRMQRAPSHKRNDRETPERPNQAIDKSTYKAVLG